MYWLRFVSIFGGINIISILDIIWYFSKKIGRFMLEILSSLLNIFLKIFLYLVSMLRPCIVLPSHCSFSFEIEIASSNWKCRVECSSDVPLGVNALQTPVLLFYLVSNPRLGPLSELVPKDSPTLTSSTKTPLCQYKNIWRHGKKSGI